MESFRVRPLSETDIHAVVKAAGGDFAHFDSDRRDKPNADFLLGPAVIELKSLDDEGLDKPERQMKLAKLFREQEPPRPVIVLDRSKLSQNRQREYDRILEGPMKAAVSKANKQLKQSRSDHPETNCSILWLVNNGYTALDHDALVRMAAHRVRNDTREIDGLVVAGCYYYSDSFDSYFTWPMDYVPVNVNHPFAAFDILKTAWNAFAEKFMTSVVLGEISGETLKGPVVDTHFSVEETVYVKPAPPMGLPSGFFKHGRPRKDSTGIKRCPPIATVFPDLNASEWLRFQELLKQLPNPITSFDEWQQHRTTAINEESSLQPLVPIEVSREGYDEWCSGRTQSIGPPSIFEYATSIFETKVRSIILSARERTENMLLPVRYVLATTEEIGQDRANDVSHIFTVREVPDSEPVVIEHVVNARMFHEHAVAVAGAYAVRNGIEFVLWQKDLTYAWV